MPNNQFQSQYSTNAPTLTELEALQDFVFLEFGSPNCGHCQAAAPSIATLITRSNKRHIKLIDGKGKLLGRQFGVKLWPTLILLEHGKELARVIRPTSDADCQPLLEFITDAQQEHN